MSAETISVEDYQKLQSIHRQHLYIRAACSGIIFICVMSMLFGFFRQIGAFSMPVFQAALVKELAPVLPDVRGRVLRAYGDNAEEIHKRLGAVISNRAPGVKAKADAEMARFIKEFPEQAGAAITRTLESSVDDYLDTLVQRYPELAGNDDLEELLDDSFSAVVLETRLLVQRDMDDIGIAVTRIHDVTQNDTVRNGVNALLAEGRVQDRVVGILLRQWAREFPGATIGYTVGDR